MAACLLMSDPPRGQKRLRVHAWCLQPPEAVSEGRARSGNPGRPAGAWCVRGGRCVPAPRVPAMGPLLARALLVSCDRCSAGPEWGRARAAPWGASVCSDVPTGPPSRALPVLLYQDSSARGGQAGRGGRGLAGDGRKPRIRGPGTHLLRKGTVWVRLGLRVPFRVGCWSDEPEED